MGNRAIDNRVAKLMELEAQKKAIEEAQEAIRAELKADMESKGVDEIKTGKYIIRWKEVVSNRFDTSSFKKDFLELYEKYSKKQASKRFTVA